MLKLLEKKSNLIIQANNSSGVWYSGKSILYLLAVLLLVVQSIAYLTPPFQSPDEYNHVNRAYLLSKGEVFLGTQNNVTGGLIDQGLLNYMDNFMSMPFNYDVKINEHMISLSRMNEWSGSRVFRGLPNTANYFPILYVPQAIAIFAGENIGLSVHDTYYLARFFTFICSMGLLWLAFVAYPSPLAVLALFVTPMSLFQLGSASLDPVSFALTALIGSLFMRGCNLAYRFTDLMYVVLVVSLFLLVTTRLNLLPLTLLPFVVYSIRQKNIYLWMTYLLIMLSVAWIIYALITVKGMPVRDLTTIQIIQYYVSHPVDLVHVLYSTLKNTDILLSYLHMFVGVLGWLDTPLPRFIYIACFVLLILLACVSFRKEKIHDEKLRISSILLTSLTVLSIVFLFLILLVSWTKHPAVFIEGIQGRYFTPLCILLCFTIFNKKLNVKEFNLGLVLLFTLFLISSTSTVIVLANRYWLSPNQNESYLKVEAVGKHFGELLNTRHFEQTFVAKDKTIKQVSLYLATFARKNTGNIILDIYDATGKSLVKVNKSMADMNDNAWLDFPIDSIGVTNNSQYKLSLTSSTGKSGNAITWWASPSDVYPNGNAIVDGEPVVSDFAFKIVFSH